MLPVAGCCICVIAAGAGMSPLGASADAIWGPFLTLTRCLLFLTGFYFSVVFPSGFGLSPHGWAWWPYLTVVVSRMLLSCCCDTWLWSWAWGSRALAQDMLPVE